MMRLLGVLALAAGISGCVAAQPNDSGYGNEPGAYAPRTDCRPLLPAATRAI